MTMSVKMRILVAGVAGALAALAFGAFALADEALAPGQYDITIPGVGTISVAVADTGGVELVTVPDGYTVTPDHDNDDDEAEFRLSDPNGVLAALKIEVEEGELKVKVDGLAPGEHSVSIPDVGVVTINVNDDGTFDVISVPDGWTFEVDSDGDETKVKLVSEDGAVEVKLELEDGTLTFKVEAEEADDEVDDEADDDDAADHDDDDRDDEDRDDDDDDDKASSKSKRGGDDDDDEGSRDSDD